LTTEMADNKLENMNAIESEMNPLTKQILSHAKSIAAELGARAIIVYGDVFAGLEELKELRKDSSIILVTKRQLDRKKLKDAVDNVINIPSIDLTRMGQIKMSMLLALSKKLLKKGDTIVCVSGIANSEVLDTIIILKLGEERETFVTTEPSPLSQDVSPEVFERVLTIATELAVEGREGHPVGALFVIGDTENVLKYCSQMVINPFKGYNRSERNILDHRLEETVKEFSALDGAFIIEGDGTIVSAGTYLRPGLRGEELPQGLGARHEAAASITASTKAIAITVSKSTGTVTAFKDGKILTEIEKPRRVATGAGAQPST